MAVGAASPITWVSPLIPILSSDNLMVKLRFKNSFKDQFCSNKNQTCANMFYKFSENVYLQSINKKELKTLQNTNVTEKAPKSIRSKDE